MRFSSSTMCLILFAASVACEDTELIRVDCIMNETQPCGLANIEHLNSVGLCSFGISHCMSGGKWGECLGEVQPSGEVCDGLDNDCDGAVDEEFPENHSLCGMLENVNYGVGICTPGIMSCDDGYLQCVGHEGPTLEICDGIDNNCNGTIDESIPNQTIEVCYDGPPHTLRVGECKAGIRYCVDGTTTSGLCEGQVLPQTEVCDSLDNDCDGEVDEGFDSGKVDLVFIIDISGSFDDEIERTIFGIEPLLTDPITSDFQFGLVLIGSRHDSEAQNEFQYMRRHTDFVTREDFMDYLTSALMLSREPTSGHEPSYDALSLVMQAQINFSFRENSHRVIILMTDEKGQSFANPPIDENFVADVARRSDYIIHVYNKREFIPDFDDILRTLNNYHNLEDHTNSAEVFESLQRIFLNVCL